MFDYGNSTALVTGASRGIGAAVARELGRRGANVVLVARSRGDLDDLAGELAREYGVAVTVIAADLADPHGPDAVVEVLEERGIVVDLLVNNAGLGPVGKFFGQSLEPSLRSIQVNVVALLRLTRLLGDDMLRRQSGGIINIGSVAAFQPMPFQATYGASKAFVLSLTEALDDELRDTGVRVMAAHPGPVSTGFFEGTTAAIDAKAVTAQTIARNLLDDFGRGRHMSLPGRRISDRATILLSRVLPRAVVARMVGSFNRRNGYAQATDDRASVAGGVDD